MHALFAIHGLHFLASLLTSLLLVRLTMLLAGPLGLMDYPSGRKDHAAATPATGGIGIYLALLINCLVFSHFKLSLDIFFIAGGWLLLVGVLDDHFNLSSRIRLAAEIIAAMHHDLFCRFTSRAFIRCGRYTRF